MLSTALSYSYLMARLQPQRTMERIAHTLLRSKLQYFYLKDFFYATLVLNLNKHHQLNLDNSSI